MIQEYKKHLRNNINPLALLFGGYLLASLLLLAGVMRILEPLHKAAGAVSGYHYSMAVESSEKNAPGYGYYKLENLVTLKSNGKIMHVNAYVAEVSENQQDLLDIGDIGADEIVVSQRVAEKLQVSPGDILYADVSVFEKAVSYKIVKIIPYIMDLYDIKRNTDFSLAVLGDKKLASISSGIHVHFMEADGIENFKTENSYKHIYDVSQEVNEIQKELNLKKGLLMTLWIIMSLLYFCFAHQRIFAETVKYYHRGYPVDKVVLIHALDHAIVLGIPLAIVSIYLIGKTASGMISAWMVGVPVFILGALVLFWCGGSIFWKKR